MSQPTPSTSPEQPEAAAVAEPESADVEVTLNRAARRAKATGSTPSHVGPRAGREDQSRGPRSHTKRQIG